MEALLKECEKPVGDLVSILMATFNGQRFLAAQIESILAQSHGEFELLVIDDGSSDSSPEILASYADLDPRIRLLPSTGNLGQKQRLTELLSASAGAFISISDQDDIWDRDKTARLLEGIDDRALTFGRSDLIDEQGLTLDQTLLGSLGVSPHPEHRLVGLFQPAVSGHAMLARREIVTEIAFRRAHAYDWLIGLDALFSNGWRYIDNAVVRHRIHDSNLSNGGNIRREQAEQQMHDLRRRLRQARMLVPGRASARRRTARRKFVQRLEHLGHSPVVAPDLRARCLQLWSACTACWYRGGVPLRGRDRRLRSLLLDRLRPLTASEHDWSEAVDQIYRLT